MPISSMTMDISMTLMMPSPQASQICQYWTNFVQAPWPSMNLQTCTLHHIHLFWVYDEMHHIPVLSIRTTATTWTDPAEEMGPVGILDTDTLDVSECISHRAMHWNLVDTITGQRQLEISVDTPKTLPVPKQSWSFWRCHGKKLDCRGMFMECIISVLYHPYPSSALMIQATEVVQDLDRDEGAMMLQVLVFHELLHIFLCPPNYGWQNEQWTEYRQAKAGSNSINTHKKMLLYGQENISTVSNTELFNCLIYLFIFF